MSLRVAFVMSGVGVVGRGAEAFVVELCDALAKCHGFEVMLYCRGDAPVPHRRIRALPRDRAWVNALYSTTQLGRKVLDTLFLDPLSIEWATASLSALPFLWHGRYDAIVMEGGLVGGWCCRLLRRFRGASWIDIAHGQDPKWEGAFARQRPDRVVVFTEAARRMILERAPGAAITVIPHGVDLSAFRPEAVPVHLDLARPVVFCAGAVDSHKRMDLAVEAVARLGHGSLVILGEGPEAEAVDRLAASRLGPTRYLRRAVPRSEIPGWYTAADCFTLPSRTESFGLTYLEAMACGLPCVAPDDAVRREVIAEAGLYCDVSDLEAYSGTLAAALAKDWQGLPRQRAERFPVTATIDRYAEVLMELKRGGRVT